MRYEDLKYVDSILPLIFRDDTLQGDFHEMYMHWHEAVEILYIVEGELRVFSGMEQKMAKQGDLVCIHAGHMHLYESITPRCHYYCLIFPREALDSKELYQSALPRITDDAVAAEWAGQLIEVLLEKPPFYRERARGLLAQLYVRLVGIGGEENLGNEPRPTRLVKNVMEYVSQHYYQPNISIERVAQAVGVSRSHLCHVFKEVTGQSVSSYWQRLRCDQGRRFLLDGYTVAEAAEWSGFSSQSYFCRAYQKHFGVLPSKDRVK